MMHNINIFCNNDYVGFIQIDLKSNNAKLKYDDNWCKKRMNLATNNGNTWSDKTVLFGH